MSSFKILLTAISAIVLFLYGLDGFGQEIQRVGERHSAICSNGGPKAVGEG
jgi:hypothetical protein